MLSLPETWDYTLRGLAAISIEGVDAIRMAVLELEKQGYIVRQQGRDEKGKLANIEYTIYEQPQPCLENPITDKPCTENSYTDKPISGNPSSDNPTQVNTKGLKTNPVIPKEKNTHGANIHQSIYPAAPDAPARGKEIDRMDEMDSYRALILDNIEYDIMADRHNKDRMDEIVEVMLDAICSKRDYIRIGGDEYPAEVVKSRLLKLDSSHIEYVFDCIDKNTTKVHNIKSYLLTTLYNAPATIDHYYTTLVNHDMYGR